jgi:hypothetical protein
MLWHEFRPSRKKSAAARLFREFVVGLQNLFRVQWSFRHFADQLLQGCAWRTPPPIGNPKKRQN